MEIIVYLIPRNVKAINKLIIDRNLNHRFYQSIRLFIGMELVVEKRGNDQ